MCIRAWLPILAIVVLVGCGTPTPEADADRTAAVATAASDLSDLEAAQREFWSQEANRARLEAYVRANATFTLFHEMAHYIFDRYDIPIAGREEDAADRLATLLMTPRDAGSGPEAEVTTSPNASDLVWVAYSWINRGHLAEEQSRAQMAWYDEHSASEQRGYDVLCLAYGSNPERFALAVQDPEIGIPDARRLALCREEAAHNASAFSRLVGAFALSGEEFARRREAYLADWQARVAQSTRQPGSARQTGSALSAALRGDAPTGDLLVLRGQAAGVFYADYGSPELFWRVPWFPWNSQAFLSRHEILETVRDALLGLRLPSDLSLPPLEAQG